MATIKDIARLAGVSHGTVSNVLNGKSNVSSDKILLVEKAAAQLGYSINESARLLRKGSSRAIALVLPNIRFRQYVDLYTSFKTYAASCGYTTTIYLTDDSPHQELRILEQLRSEMVGGVAAISCLPEATRLYGELGLEPGGVLFVERTHLTATHIVSFDYYKCGEALGARAVESHYQTVAVVTGSLCYSNELDFYNGFMQAVAVSQAHSVKHLQTDINRKNQNIMQLLETTHRVEAIFVSNYGFAETLKDIWTQFFGNLPLKIYTVSPTYTLPEGDFEKYELNYRQLGKAAAQRLVGNLMAAVPQSQLVLDSYGFRYWQPRATDTCRSTQLQVLTIDSPEATIMQTMSRLYEKETGNRVSISVYSYDEIHEIIANMEQESHYDVVRMDVTMLPWLAPRILLPLADLDPNVSDIFDDFVEGVAQRFAVVNGCVYALPVTPSVQMLYYRSDLFQSTVLRRLFQERYKRELLPPRSFQEYNQIAQFFTRQFNPASPVEYGTSLTLGSTGVACSEFLARYFSHCRNLYGQDNKIDLSTPIARQAMQELIELRQFAPPQYCNWWKDTAAQLADGSIAMSILYSNYASDLYAQSSKISGSIGYAPVPGNNPCIGGGCLGISKYSQNPAAALQFIKWMCSEPITSASTLLGSVSPCKKTFENYEIIDTFPWLELAKDSFATAGGLRVPVGYARPFDEKHFVNIVGRAVKDVYGNPADLPAAMVRAQQEIAALLER